MALKKKIVQDQRFLKSPLVWLLRIASWKEAMVKF